MWPVALLALLSPGRGGSTWFSVHARQAVVFGILATLGLVAALGFPLLIVIVAVGISAQNTIWLYGLWFLVDVAAFVAVLGFAIRYSSRASRGEMFEIPVVSRLADRLFRKQG